MDPFLPPMVGLAFLVLLIGLTTKRLRLPTVVAYLLAGMLAGPHGVGLVSEHETPERMGEFGVILLLFFAGLEVSLPDLLARWNVPIIGTIVQVLLSIGLVAGIGAYDGWPLARVVLIGFVVSLSSTAVVLKLLGERGELELPVGRDVVSILLAQDVAIIPMMIVLGLFAGQAPNTSAVAMQLAGGAVAIAVLLYVGRGGSFRSVVGRRVSDDPELQVFEAFVVCFGLACLTGFAGLSTALGAFLGGVVVGSAKDTAWVHAVLYPLQVLFLAMFFVSIGMMLDFGFLLRNALLLVELLAVVFVMGTGVNLLVFRLLGRPWRDSVYGGALLAATGEFGFVLAALGLQSGIVERYAYQLTVAVVALSLLLSPAWVTLLRTFVSERTPNDSRTVAT